MRTTSRNSTRLAPVEADEVRIRPIDPSDRREMLLEERILRSQIARERSSAYWFAATKWGVAGLVIGIAAGAYIMYVAMLGSVPLVEETMTKARAIEAVRTQMEEAAGTTADEASPAQPKQGR